MRPFWNIFQPAEKPQAAVGEKHAVGTTSPPQPLPEPRSPIFQRYPPRKQEWAFAGSADGRHLQSLWQNVKTGDGQPLASRAGFLPFATALRRALETSRTTAFTVMVCGDGKTNGSGPDPMPAMRLAPSRTLQHENDSEASQLGPDVAVVPAVAGGARGIPTDVVRGLVQAVLSASACRCGREVAADPPAGLGCPTHGLAALTWARVLPSGGLQGRAEDLVGDGGDTKEAWLGGGGGGGGVSVGDDATNDGNGAACSTLGGRAMRRMVSGTERWRACLVEALRTLSMACRCPHTREELARQCRGGRGGIAKGLGLLCDALCSRVTELRRRRQGPFRRSISTAGSSADRARQDLLFFVHCLVPLARIVADSAPAAAAWYDQVNDNTLAGTGLPRHPWVGSASGGGGSVPSCATPTAANTADVKRMPKVGNVAVGGDLFTSTNAEEDAKCDAHNPDVDSEEANFTAVDSAADKDEWSAMLVSANLVRSLVGALQACLDARIAARGEIVGDVPKRKPEVGQSCQVESLTSPEPEESGATYRWVRPQGNKGTGGETYACLGCELDSAQVTVTLALGALLSAHRLAARDRFQLAGGPRRFHRVVSQPHSSRDGLHACLLRREGCTDAAASAVAMPFLHEHCALVSMQVLRLCLRSGVSEVVPPDVIEGAAQMVGALSPLMRSALGKQGVGRPLDRGRGSRPRSWGPSDYGQEFQEGETEAGTSDASGNFTVPGPETRRRALSRTLLPLDCPGKVVVEPASNAAKENSFSAQQGSASTRGCHTGVHHTLEAPSYLLCGPQTDKPPSSSSFHDSTAAGGVEGGIQILARDRGADAVAVASALHSRLAASLAVQDILILAESGCGASCPQVSPEEVDESGPDGGGLTAYTEDVSSNAPLSGSSVVVLMGFHDSMLSIIGDCAAGVERYHGSAQPPRTAGAGVAAFVEDTVEIHSAVLRSALMSFVELVVGPHVVSCAHAASSDIETNGRGSPGQLTGDTMPLRPGGALESRQGKPSRLLALGERGMAVAPVPQLVALKFFFQAMLRWPRPAVKLMQEVGVWDILFSERFLSGGTPLVARAVESLEDNPTLSRMAAATASDGPNTIGNGSSVGDDAVGWGLLHDATLLLLEAVTVSRCFLRMEKVAAESSSQRHVRKQGRLKWRVVGDDELGTHRPCEVRTYVRFLARDESTQPSHITAIQGCRWLRALVATEFAIGGGMLLPTTLRVAAVRLAFRFCDRGNAVGSETRGLGGAAWPLVYASLSLVRDLVNENGRHSGGLLFQAAAALALDVDAASAMTGATVKSRTHRATASMTSDASTPSLHAANTWCAPESAGSRTPVSTDNTSPRVPRRFSFGDASSSPPKPRPLPEVLFKAALDPRVRCVALYFAAKLGVEAGIEVITSPDVDVWSMKGPNRQPGGRRPGNHSTREPLATRETAVEVLSGLVEGYLCLCERAAAAIRTGSAGIYDGEGLLLDVLNGACALMRLGAPSYQPVERARTRGVGEGAGWRAVGVPSRHARATDSGVSPLLQETFREHRASARLLAMLESVVAGPLTPMSPANCADVVSTSLALFTSMMAGNSLCKKAFQRAVIDRYARNIASSAFPPSSQPPPGPETGADKRIDGGSFAALANLAAVVPAERLSRALMEMLLDGEVPACVLDVTKTGRGRERDRADEANDQNSEGAGDNVATVEGGSSSRTAVSPPEIRNPLVVPLIFGLLPDWPVLEQERVMKAFCLLLRGTGGGMVNRSLCCDIKPALMDQLLDILPRLDAGGSEGEDVLQGLAIDLVRHLGSHSINVAQLKKMFRLMQPLSSSPFSEQDGGTSYVDRRRRSGSGAKTPSTSLAAPLQPPWLCCLLRALRGMMDDEPGPRRFFLFDGLTSGLRLPEMPRWPAQKGYTFCAWVRLEAPLTPSTGSAGGVGGVHNTARIAKAPCLFSFCGERGQGVAACFIPLRKGHGRQSGGAAAPAGTTGRATPQKYALELRVGTGRSRPPACVRFPAAVATDGEWVFVAVVHAASNWGQRGEASVLVDSCWRTSASPFPRFGDGGVTTASVACHCPPQVLERRDRSSDKEGAGARIAGRPILCSLRGQMGPIYLFAGTMSEELLRGIRKLGPSYAYSFEPPRVDSREIALLPTPDPHLQALSELDRDIPGANPANLGKARGDGGSSRAETPAEAAAKAARQHAHLAALSGALTPLILLAYNPGVWSGEYFLDNTPECNPVRWTTGSPASSSTRKQWEPDGASRARAIYSMAGSQAHVLVQPPHPGTRRGASGSAGSSDGAQAEQALSDGRDSSAHRPNATRRTRGWSGWSGYSEEDNVFGGEEDESAPSVRPRPRAGYMHAMRLPGTRESVTRDVRDALDCLGGVKVLLPLFAQYDHGVLQDAGHVRYQTDPRLNETVLALLAGTLRDSLPNHRFLRRHGGLSLIPHCLERVSPQHMSSDALAQACRLADRLGSWSEEWADSAIESLLSPSRLWVFAPPEAQLTLVGLLRGMTRRCPGRMRRVVGFQRCLDALDLYYWYTPPSSENIDGESRSRRGRGGHGGTDGGGGAVDSKGWSYASRQWVHPSTGEVLGLKASGAALREIRARLLDTAVIMACDGDGVSRSEVAAMLGFLRGCRDDSSRCEALRLILRLTDNHRQAGRFVVASGYVAEERYDGDSGDAGDACGDRADDVGSHEGTGRFPGRGGAAVALLLALLQGDDPTVRLLAFLALGQVLIACLRIEDRNNAINALPDKQGHVYQSATNHGERDVSATARQDGSTSPDAATPTPAAQSAASSTPSNTAVVEFMGRADAKAEELVVLTGASSSRGGRHPRTVERRQGRTGRGIGKERDAEELLELRGGIWEHVGLPRRRIADVLLWAQRHVTKADSGGAVPSSSGGSPGGGWMPDVQRRQEGETSERKLRPDEGAAAERTVARVAMGVLQGLLIGELPRGFAASVVSSSGRRKEPRDSNADPAREATLPIVSSSSDQLLDPFFLETPMATAGAFGTGGEYAFGGRNRGPSRGDSTGPRGGGASQRSHSRSRPGRNGSAKSVSPPLRISLPEAFPALCQQVATAPVGPAPRGEVIETLVAAVHNQRNSESILSVDSWQQYLLSVVSSAQGRQAVAASADVAATADAASSRGEHYSGTDRPSAAELAEDGGPRRYERRSARDEATEEGLVMDRTLRLICWLSMWEAREGSPGRPGAGFAALKDTMSFLRCQGELGTMECVSIGERILRHMVSLLKREIDRLESEINGWARGSHLPPLRPLPGVSGGRHGTAAALACVWPLASLVVEFIVIPPVANPPAASAANAPTPSAAALAVSTAAADHGCGPRFRGSDDPFTCPSPMQGILQWLDTGMRLPSHTHPFTPNSRPNLPRMGSPLLPATSNSAAGWRAWELLEAAVDLIGPTGDTLLWDARYRHGLSVETGIGGSRGEGVYASGAVDPSAAEVLDWGRPGSASLGRRDDTRTAGDRGTPGAPVRRGGDADSRGPWFIDARGRKGNPLADAGGVPWMLVRLLLAIFVSGGAAEGNNEVGTWAQGSARRPSSGRAAGGSAGSGGSGKSASGGTGKGGGGAGSGPPSIALVALQRLIALMNSLESSGYKHFEFEVLHMVARISTALRTTRLTPLSAWVLGALQLLAKCLAAKASQIEDLLVAGEERLHARKNAEHVNRTPSAPSAPGEERESFPPRTRLVFSRGSKRTGWWFWDFLSGGGGDKANRRRIARKGVLHQIAAETPSLAVVPSGDLALEIIRRTLGIELPGRPQGQDRTKRGRGGAAGGGAAAASTVGAAPLTWDLLEAAFEPVSEDGAGQEAMGFATRLNQGGMHRNMLQVLVRVRALEARGVEAGVRVPADVQTLVTQVLRMEARRATTVGEAKERATSRRQAQWEAVLKQLATERGPWGRGVEAVDLDSVYWALSPGEDDRGRRLKLVRNPHGGAHTIASERTRGVTRPTAVSSRPSSRWGWRPSLKAPLRRASECGTFSDPAGDAASSAAGAGQAGEDSGLAEGQNSGRVDEWRDVRAMSAQTSLWKDLCKYQRKSIKPAQVGEGLDDGDETDDEEDEEEDLEDSSELGESDFGDEDNDGDAGCDGPRRGGRPTAPVAYSSTADVVRPFCVTPGVVSLEDQRLVFTRSQDSSLGCAEGTKDKRGDQPLADNYRWALRQVPSSSWPTSGLRRVLFRPYGGMRFAALEMWYAGGGADEDGCTEGTLLLGLPSESLARGLHEALRRARPPALEPFLGRLPSTVIARSNAGTWGASASGGVGMLAGPSSGGRGGMLGSGAGVKAAAAVEAARTPLTQAWVRRRCGVTNFDYLRGLNAAAGRTTADLSRYPVFPWVLSERALRAEELDLKDERNFRDLAWPMGAQRPEQREALHMRYAELERSYVEQQGMGGEMADLALPPFHHGSHYSSSAYVLWFLMRLEPFTSLHIHLQDGRFDKADRLFQSLPDAYASCTRNPGDVKEAIPELYFLPELLVNANGLDLGCPQSTGMPLSDVELPPWAHGDPWEFVRRHREALESEHVSLRLHAWIDLVFGCRQRPPALNRGRRGAVESCNVFFHLTYPGAVDLPRLREQDPQLYESTMKQIEEFGQAPAQLFRSAHPPRLPFARAEVVRPIASPIPGANTAPLTEALPSVVAQAECDSAREVDSTGLAQTVVSYPRKRVSRGAVLVISDLHPWTERLVTVDARRAIGFHGWRVLSPEMSPPFRLRPDAVETALKDVYERRGERGGDNGAGDGAGTRVRRLNVPFAPDVVASSRLLAPPIGGGGGHGGGCGHAFPTRLLGGLGGSYDSLASMRSLLSLPQSTAPVSEPLQPSWSPYAMNDSSPRGGAPLNAFHHRQLGSGTSLCALDSDSNASRGGGGRGSGGCWGRYSGTGGGVGLGSQLFAVYAEFRLLFSGGHWDCSFRATALDTGKLIVSIARHRGVVMSLSLTDGGHGCCRLVTSSRDTTLMVWKVDPGREPPVSASSLLHVLYGHDTPITCVCASAALDAIVSSGEDGTLVVHTVWRGEYVRTITPRGQASPVAVPDSAPGRQRHSRESTRDHGNEEFDEISKRDDGRDSSSNCAKAEGTTGAKREARSIPNAKRRGRLPPPWPSVEWVGLSAAGYIVAYSPADATLRSYTINGHALGVTRVASEAGPLRAFVFSEDGSVLLSGGCDRAVTLRWAHSLAVADDDAREGSGEAVLDGSTPPLAGVLGTVEFVTKFGSAVRCLTLTAGEQHLLVGLEDGTLGILALDARYLRQRLRSKLDQLGI